jgi:hypothetical protein
MSDGSMKDDRGEKTPKRSLRPKRKTRVARHYDTDEDEEEYYSSESEEEAPKRRKQTPLKSEESAGSENQSEETPSSQQNENHPLLGLTIRMNSGKGAGHVGKITKICSRGWLEVDGLDGFKVHGHLMSIVDDGKLDKKAIKDYYSAGRSRTKMPNIIKLDDKVHGDEGGDTVVDWGEDENEGLEMQDEANNSDDNILISRASRYRNTKNRTEKDENRFIDKISSTDFSGATIDQEDSTTPDGRMSEAESIVRWGRKPASSLAVPNMPKLKDLNPGRRRVRLRGSSVPVLDPILIQTSSTYFAGKDEGDKKNSLKLLVPESLRHLDSDTKIEIFNRRTGKIMRGEESISLSDLPAALMDHPEYEPIVPVQSALK